MRAINLLPRDDASQSRKLPPPPVLAACIGAVVMTALLAVMFLSASGKVAKQQRALQDVQATYNALPAPAAPPAAASDLPKLRTTRLTALSSAIGQRVDWDRLLREVSQVVPSDVWLLTLTAQAPALGDAAATAQSVPGTTTQTFVVTGCTYSQDSVARFLARLDVVPDLTGMTLGQAQSGGSDSTASGSATAGSCPKAMVSFSLQGAVSPIGATS